jgi:hypothetical protein
MKKVLFILLAAVFSTGTLHAQKPEVVTKNEPGWHKIGDSKVDFKSDKDQFAIVGRDRFKAILFKVNDAHVHFDDVQIFYEGGGKENIPVNADLNPGTESQVINLKNGSAELKKVVFVYRTVANSNVDKAQVKLWGEK